MIGLLVLGVIPLGSLAMFLQTVFDRPRPRTPFVFFALQALLVAFLFASAFEACAVILFLMGLTTIAIATEIQVHRELHQHWAIPVWGLLVTASTALTVACLAALC
ncbi:MAG TPA: hypothetical protein VHB77_14435 [Planctomycetaceae bacterium]|nr:hypothetical protein [Planctomycetaceae bacterium]